MSEFKIAAVFSDNMVLQRGKQINIFGEGEDGARVSAELFGFSASAPVIGGKWLIKLPAINDYTPKGESTELKISSGNFSRSFKNVVIGEVWVAGGQSNMELELQNCKGGKDCLENDKDVNVRFYYTQKNPVIDEKFLRDELNTGWSEFNSESAKCWSAVAYFFGKKLSAELGVTVGILGCNWGGTSASYWMPRDVLLEDRDTRVYVDEYDAAIKGKTEAELEKEYVDYLEYEKKFNAASEKFYRENPNGEWSDLLKIAGECKYPGPLCPRNPFHATALYDSMLKRVAPYTNAGVIWYQGETDDNRPRTYYKLFTRMIRVWREDFGDAELPFIITQLPMHRYKQDADFKHWCLIREAQEMTFKTVKNTGLAIILDCGEFNEIHPKDKKPVGARLEAQAMELVYNSRDPRHFSPMYKDCTFRDGGALISFNYAPDGFEIKPDHLSGKIAESLGFEIAGYDKEFVPAKAEIKGSEIFVSSEKVQEPAYVRYLWTNFGEVNLFGKNGLPVAPFRTSTNDEKKEN